VFVYDLVAISLRYFESGKHRAVYCVEHFVQFCFGAALNYVDP
jgi:hypothetical protein